MRSERPPRLLFALVVGAIALAASAAWASVSIAVTWDNLLKQSTMAVIGTPLDATASWQSGRIYTFTRLHVDRIVAGSAPPGDEVSVRTMGGIVRNVGQRVEGEAILQPGQPSLFFLHPGSSGTFDVTARAQGQYVVVADESKAAVKILRSVAAGAIVLPRNTSARLAHDALHERPAEDAAQDIASSWSASHAP